MQYDAGIDVSLEQSSVCVVDVAGKIVREAKVASDPHVLVRFFKGLGFPVRRIGLEAGPLSQWLWNLWTALDSALYRQSRSLPDL
jgi:transposase